MIREAQRLLKLVKRSGLSQAEIAAYVQVSTDCLDCWEAGRVRYPRAAALVRLRALVVRCERGATRRAA